ncbi:hypothetical protein SCUP234_05987 [Seiridium cupressi]
MSFILQPVIDGVLDTTIEWDLESTPSGTRAACSLGEGIRFSAHIKAADLDGVSLQSDLCIAIHLMRRKCASGRGLHRGFVFAWTTVVPRDSDDIDEFLMHEMVHNWPRLEHSVGGPTTEEMANGWFNEGIAEYYSLVLPIRQEQSHNIAVWNLMLKKELGPAAETSYQEMSEAVSIVLASDYLRVIEGL